MRAPTPTILLLSVLCLACPPAPPAGEADLAAPPAGSVDGGTGDAGGVMACTGPGGCVPGQVCHGPPGCGANWSCAAMACTRDLVPFCGCDGVTFRSSSTCPGQPYKHKGTCESCAPQEARGVGGCDAILGVYWDGARCVSVSGCRCEGKDCGSGHRTLEACEAAHGDCRGDLRADGAPCSKGAECRSGVCEGEGCGPDQARCAPKVRVCTRDLVFYCGCDGETFGASSSCPGRPYKHKGPC